jgi:hypothetical protein
MDNVVRMDIVDSLDDLLHEDAAGQLAQHKLLLDHPVKQLPPTNAKKERNVILKRQCRKSFDFCYFLPADYPIGPRLRW